MAAELGVPFLGRIPIYQPIREGSDSGVPLMISEPDSPAARAFMAAAERTAAQVSIASYNRPDDSVDGGEMTMTRRALNASCGSTLRLAIGCLRRAVAVHAGAADRRTRRPRAAR